MCSALHRNNKRISNVAFWALLFLLFRGLGSTHDFCSFCSRSLSRSDFFRRFPKPARWQWRQWAKVNFLNSGPGENCQLFSPIHLTANENRRLDIELHGIKFRSDLIRGEIERWMNRFGGQEDRKNRIIFLRCRTVIFARMTSLKLILCPSFSVESQSAQHRLPRQRFFSWSEENETDLICWSNWQKY